MENTKTDIRIIVLHPKGLDSELLQELKTDIANTVSKLIPTATISVTLGQEDFEANFSRAGGWGPWCTDVATRIEYVTREPVYTTYLVIDDYLGKATADIVKQALTAGKQVRKYENGNFKFVKNIQCLDPEDYQLGWKII